MKVDVQQTRGATVAQQGLSPSQIGEGLVCFVGICATDTAEDVAWCANKILNARLWGSPQTGDSKAKPWSQSAMHKR
jgi:D-Tyr-tRNAtyr deacylase